jgi:hypothetical protein
MLRSIRRSEFEVQTCTNVIFWSYEARAMDGFDGTPARAP